VAAVAPSSTPKARSSAWTPPSWTPSPSIPTVPYCWKRRNA